ncbi:MAG: MATE family efflux transporter [Eubacteriales bacterium]|nr:MATE family efflux transporter [Eubacteriales bacterium]
MDQNKLASAKVSALLYRLALPAICAQVVTLLYNMVDRIYIGRMEDGILAMAGVGVCAPLLSVISALTGLFGRGGSPLAAISMGKQNKEEAEVYLGNSFTMLLLTSVLITLVLLLGKAPILRLFGASDATLPFADQYLTLYCLGTVFVQLTVGMNYYITTQGFAATAMVTTMLGGVLNIALDPLFMFGLNMGVAGAALATVLSQFASFVWVLLFLFGRKTLLRIRLKNLRPNRAALGQMMVLGSAPCFMSASEGLLHICFNNQALQYGGNVAVSAMTILFTMFQVVLLPIEGVAQGSQPIIGYNYGTRAYGRVRETIRLALKAATWMGVAMGCAVAAFPEPFIRLFNADPVLCGVGAPMLRLYMAGMFLHGPNATFQQTYTSLGEGKKSFFFAFLRKIVLLIPLLYLCPAILPAWGVLSVVLAEPIADTLTTLSNALYFRRFLQKKLPME